MVGSGCDQLVVGYADLVVVLSIWLLFRWLGVVVTNLLLVMLIWRLFLLSGCYLDGWEWL